MSSNKKDSAIVPVAKAGITLHEEVPEFLRSEVGNYAGMESVEQTDILLPRLGLCQALSPQRKKGHASFIEGLNEGDLFNTLTQEIYGDELEIVALFFFKNRIKYFSLVDGGGIDCISTNGVDGGRISPVGCASCKFSVWGNGAMDDEHGNDAPECTLYHNFMAWVPSAGTPIAISYKSTGLKMSKQLLGAIRLTRLPMYAKKYLVKVVEMKANNNTWFEKKVIPQGFLEKEIFIEMEKAFKALRETDFKIDTTGEEGDTSFDAPAESSAF
jgi:hypothetical protein